LFSKYLYSEGAYFKGQTAFETAQEILRLFGAEKLYNPPEKKEVAKKHYPKDIMVSGFYTVSDNNIDEATAFYLGWTKSPPKVIYKDHWAY
jgi:hypothetical protein